MNGPTTACVACGFPVPPAASICGRCAHPVGEPPPAPKPAQSPWVQRLGPLGVVASILAKGKFLILGLGKLSTLLSMFASFAAYWSLWGWKFAAGFVIGIYIHEMGHVWMLRHYGLRASAPMFVPGFGAFVSLYDSPADFAQDARIGLAGPLWGAGAGLACLLVSILTGDGGALAAVGHATAYINLFNLIPVWMFDGGRGFRALDYRQRLLWLGLAVVLWYVTNSGLFLFLLIGGAYRVFWKKDHAPTPDQGVLLQFAGLMILLGAMLAPGR